MALNLLDLKSFGERIASRDPDRQTAQDHIRIPLMNRLKARLGRAGPAAVAIGADVAIPAIRTWQQHLDPNPRRGGWSLLRSRIARTNEQLDETKISSSDRNRGIRGTFDNRGGRRSFRSKEQRLTLLECLYQQDVRVRDVRHRGRDAVVTGKGFGAIRLLGVGSTKGDEQGDGCGADGNAARGPILMLLRSACEGGPAPLLFRSGAHVKRPSARRPRVISSRGLSVCGAGCRSH